MVVYLPDELVNLLRESYPECKSPGEVIATFILEVLSREIEKRELKHADELETLAKAELVRLRLRKRQTMGEKLERSQVRQT